MNVLDGFVAEEVETRRTPIAVIVAVVVAAALIFGAIVVGVTAAIVAVSHTDQGLCGDLGAPCTSLSLDRVRGLSGVDLPDGTRVTGAYYNRTKGLESFWAAVLLPDAAKNPVAGQNYQQQGVASIAAERSWAKRMHSLVYLGTVDGGVPHSAVSAVDRAGHRELFLSFTSRG